jgi:O-antigen ligase
MFNILFFSLLLVSFIIQNFNYDLVHYSNIGLIIAISILALLVNFKKIKFPKYPTIFFSIYLIITLISLQINISNLVFGKTHGYMQLALQASLFLFFICGYNLKEGIKKYLFKYLYIVSVVSILFYIFSIFWGNIYSPVNYYQMYFFSNKSHNHLGDLLVLPIIIAIFNLDKRTVFNLATIIVSYFFCLFSYSRSAYLALMIGLYSMIGLVKTTKFQKQLIVVMTIVMLIFSIILVRDKKYAITNTYSKLNKSFTNDIGKNAKKLFSERDIFLSEVIYGFAEKPILGFGINNFISLSKKHFVDKNIDPSDKPKYTISTSHNMILDILCESGIFAFIFYLLFLGYILIHSQKNLYFILAITMLTNFMFDYTFEIPPFMLIFYLLLGIIYDEKFK